MCLSQVSVLETCREMPGGLVLKLFVVRIWVFAMIWPGDEIPAVLTSRDIRMSWETVNYALPSEKAYGYSYRPLNLFSFFLPTTITVAVMAHSRLDIELSKMLSLTCMQPIWGSWAKE